MHSHRANKISIANFQRNIYVNCTWKTGTRKFLATVDVLNQQELILIFLLNIILNILMKN